MQDALYRIDLLKWAFNPQRRREQIVRKPMPAAGELSLSDTTEGEDSNSEKDRCSLASRSTSQPLRGQKSRIGQTTLDRCRLLQSRRRRYQNGHSQQPSQYRAAKEPTSTPTYNIPKWHALTHYTEQVEECGSPDGFSTNRPEVGHRVRRIKSMAMNCYIEWLNTDQISEAETSINANESTVPVKAFIDLTNLGWKLTHKEALNYSVPPSQRKHWRHACNVAENIKIAAFAPAVATFI